MPIYRHPSEVIEHISRGDLRNLNVAFINMPLRETAVPNTTPEGPLLLATRLSREYGVSVSVMDLNGYRIKDSVAKAQGLTNGRHLSEQEVLELIKKHFLVYGRPDVTALSGMITTLRWQKTVAKMVRKLLPQVFLISGGGLATELKTGLFHFIPELNGVAHSEGDDVVVKICYDAAVIKRQGTRSAVNSGKMAPYYLGEIEGQHRFLYAGDRPKDLNLLPFADLNLIKEDANGYQVLEYYLSNAVWGTSANNSSAAPFTMTRSTTSVSSRGCPFDCEFCYRGAQGERKWGIRSAQHITNEIVEHMEKYGIDFKGFPDDNFAVATERIKDLIPLLKPLNIRWGTHTRLDEAAGLKQGRGIGQLVFEDPLRVELMAQAGCVYIGFGAESASAKILEVLGKGGHTLINGLVEMNIGGEKYEFPRSMVEGIKNCRKAGMHANCTWIIGSPTETLEDIKTSVAFMQWQKEYYGQFGISPEAVNKKMFTLTWYPGTKMIRHPKVREELRRVFDIRFDPKNFEPVCDDNFENYCLQLDDATKVLLNDKGEPLNFSDVPLEQFMRIRELIDTDRTFEILNL